MTSAIIGMGAKLQRGDGGTPTENFTDIAEVRNITGPGPTMDTVDATHLGSPGGWEESIAGVLRAGEVTFELNYIPTEATHKATGGLLGDLKNKTKRNFKLLFPDASITTWSFSAWVTRFEPGTPHDDKLVANVTLKITGQPTLA